MASIKDRRTQLARDTGELATLNTALSDIKTGTGNKVLIRQMTTRRNNLGKRVNRETAAIETAEHGTARERVLKDVNKRLAEMDVSGAAIGSIPTTFFQGARHAAGWATLSKDFTGEARHAEALALIAEQVAGAFEDGAFVLVRNGTGPLTVRYGRTRKAKEAK